MNVEQLRQHLVRMASVSAPIALTDLRHDHEISCVDGRKADTVVGAPGGNAGLFILMLATLESLTGAQLSPPHVSDLFASYLDEFGTFYMHTDDLALGRLQTELEKQSDGERLAQVPIETLVRRPPDDAQPLLRTLLLDPDHVGCGHLMLMLKHPDQYGVRRELVQSVFTIYFQGLWEGDHRLAFDVLEGAHDEKAVVKVHVDRDESDESEIALAVPRYEDTDVFVYHPEAAAYFERENAAFLSRYGAIEPDDVEPFTAKQKSLGLEQLTATLRHLASTLPVFDATFRVHGRRVECTDVRSAA